MPNFRKISFVLLGVCFLGSPLYAMDLSWVYELQDRKEELLVRRIAEFWKDGDERLVQIQIEEYLAVHPKTELADRLRLFLGDLHLEQKRYQKALDAYGLIQKEKIAKLALFHEVKALFMLNRYEQIIKKENKSFDYASILSLQEQVEWEFFFAESYLHEAKHSQSLQKLYLQKAEHFYQRLLSSHFRLASLQGLAESCQLLDKPLKAADLYSLLAIEDGKEKNKWLYHSAICMEKLRPDAAFLIFESLKDVEDEISGEALHHSIGMLFQKGQYQEVLDRVQVLSEQCPTVSFWQAQSYYHLGELEKASPLLMGVIHDNLVSDAFYRESLLSQMEIAFLAHNQALFSQMFVLFQGRFSHDPESARLECAHASLIASSGNVHLGLQMMGKTLTTNQDFPQRERYLLSYMQLCFDHAEYLNAYKAAKELLADPLFEAKQEVIPTFLFVANRLQAQMEASYSKKEFYQDLVQIEHFFPDLAAHEQEALLFFICKTAVDIKMYPESIDYGQRLITKYKNSVHFANTHMLLSFDYKQLGNEQLFQIYGEKALEAGQTLQAEATVRTQLYNSYLLEAKNKEQKTHITQEDVERMMECKWKAAGHLYQLLFTLQSKMGQEPYLWLAQFYFDKTGLHESFIDPVMSASLELKEEDLKMAAERSALAYEKIFAKEFYSSDQFLEKDALKYQRILTSLGKEEERIAFLDKMEQVYLQNVSVKWKHEKEFFAHRGRLEETRGKFAKAKDYFAYAKTLFSGKATFLSEYVEFHLARLEFSLLTPEELFEDHPKVAQVLVTLKGLQVNKNPAWEPLHLEASLEYAKIRAMLAPPEVREQRYLFFLERIREDFSQSKDPMVAYYHNFLKQNSFQMAVYQNYMHFLEGEILRVRALASKNNPQQAAEFFGQALALFKYCQQNGHLTPYLSERICQLLQEPISWEPPMDLRFDFFAMSGKQW